MGDGDGRAHPGEGSIAKLARAQSEVASDDEEAPAGTFKFKPGIKFKLPQ